MNPSYTDVHNKDMNRPRCTSGELAEGNKYEGLPTAIPSGFTGQELAMSLLVIIINR